MALWHGSVIHNTSMANATGYIYDRSLPITRMAGSADRHYRRAHTVFFSDKESDDAPIGISLHEEELDQFIGILTAVKKDLDEARPSDELGDGVSCPGVVLVPSSLYG